MTTMELEGLLYLLVVGGEREGRVMVGGEAKEEDEDDDRSESSYNYAGRR